MDAMDSAPGREADFLLEQFVSAANSGGFSVGITVDLHGMMLTGELIGVRDYFEALGLALSNAIRSRNAEVADSLLRDYREAGAKLYDNHMKYEAALAAGEAGKPPAYFHMKDARTFVGLRTIPTGQGMLFRGRIADVSGFAIGTIGTASGDTR